MHQIQFRLQGSTLDPAGGAYSAPPDPLAGFNGPTSKGREGKKGEEGRGGPQYFYKVGAYEYVPCPL